MIFISHRGNLNGVAKNEENNPEKINYCLSLNYHVEIDVWRINNDFFLGHDEPQFFVDLQFLSKPGLWCHAKNLDALNSMLNHKNINCFWHQTDDFTLTSHGYIWTFLNKPLTKMSIAVMPEKADYKIECLKNIYGICTDNVFLFRKEIENG